MGDSMRSNAINPPRKMLGMRGESLVRRGESLRKRLAEPEIERLLGHVIARALELAEIPKEAAWRTMGYSDGSSLSRWIAGAEPPQLAVLWTLGPAFRRGFVVALAEIAGTEVVIRTVVEMHHSRKAVNQ